jgi:uncharacterized protein
MGAYFLDTSALIKRYIDEQGHQWVRALYITNPKHTLVISQITLAECVATLCRKAREQSISLTERDAFIDLFYRHRQRVYQMVPVTNAVCVQAGTLCKAHRLRTYDAIQLASAILYRQQAIIEQKTLPTFTSADTQLIIVAQAEGFITESPLSYP